MHKEEEDEEGEDDDDTKDGGGSNNGRAIGQRAKKGSNNLIKDRQPPQKGQSNMVGLFNQAAPYKGGFYAAEPETLQEYARAGVPANYNTGGSVSQSS